MKCKTALQKEKPMSLRDLKLPDHRNGFYGEEVKYKAPEDRKKAIEYLKLWKKFFYKRFRNFVPLRSDYESDTIIENSIKDEDGYTTIGIKIAFVECDRNICNH
jgi:hypothetical protein